MSFYYPETETFTVKQVTAFAPTNNGLREGVFEATYRRVSAERYGPLVSSVVHFSDGDSVEDVIRKRRDALDEVLENVRGFVDEKGVERDADDQRRLVLTQLPLTNAAWDAFIQNYTGAAAKNSKPSPRR